jgi:hypothetical protein
VFYHKSCLCFTTNCFFVLPQIVSLFYYKLFLCFITHHFLFCHKSSQNVWLSVSKWLLFIVNSAVFLAISWREQFIFQWDDYYSASSLSKSYMTTSYGVMVVYSPAECGKAWFWDPVGSNQRLKLEFVASSLSKQH